MTIAVPRAAHDLLTPDERARLEHTTVPTAARRLTDAVTAVSRMEARRRGVASSDPGYHLRDSAWRELAVAADELRFVLHQEH